MKKLLALTILLSLGMGGTVWADAIPEVISATTSGSGQHLVTVFNDSGSTLTSGTVVAWDNDDTEFDRSGYPYVTTTASADFIWTAGVMETPSCLDQTLCTIIVRGFAWTRTVGNLTEDTVVSTSTTSGRAGDSTAGNNVCYLGRLMENYNKETGATCAASSNCVNPVYVNVTCVP